jgi:hypothetical protein
MKSITLRLHVEPDGSGNFVAPPELAPGDHDVTLRLVEGGEGAGPEPQQVNEAILEFLALPPVQMEHWPEGFSVRREEIYGDWGR